MPSRISNAVQEFESRCRSEAASGSARCNFFVQEFLREHFPSEEGEAAQLSDEMYEVIKKMGFPEFGRQAKTFLFVTWPVNPMKLRSAGTHHDLIRHLVHMTTQSEIFRHAFAEVEAQAARQGEPLTTDYLNFGSGFNMQHFLRRAYPDIKVNPEGVRLACVLKVKEMFLDERRFPTETVQAFHTRIGRESDAPLPLNTVGVNKFGNTMRIFENHTLGNRLFDHVPEEDNTYQRRHEVHDAGASHIDSHQNAAEKYGDRYAAYPDHPYKSMSAFESRAGHSFHARPNAGQTPLPGMHQNEVHVHQPDRTVHSKEGFQSNVFATVNSESAYSPRHGGVFHLRPPRGIFASSMSMSPTQRAIPVANSSAHEAGQLRHLHPGEAGVQPYTSGMHQPYQSFGMHQPYQSFGMPSARHSVESRKSAECQLSSCLA